MVNLSDYNSYLKQLKEDDLSRECESIAWENNFYFDELTHESHWKIGACKVECKRRNKMNIFDKAIATINSQDN